MSHKVLGIVGWKNSGKTTLITKIIAELTGRGMRVASIKHAHHDATVDHPGSDTFRHRSAGATEVALVTGSRWALIHESDDDAEPTLKEILERLSPCDIVIVEGYKREPIAKIETRRAASTKSELLASHDPAIIAVAADHPTDVAGRPSFDINDVKGITDFIVSHHSLDASRLPRQSTN